MSQINDKGIRSGDSKILVFGTTIKQSDIKQSDTFGASSHVCAGETLERKQLAEGLEVEGRALKLWTFLRWFNKIKRVMIRLKTSHGPRYL